MKKSRLVNEKTFSLCGSESRLANDQGKDVFMLNSRFVILIVFLVSSSAIGFEWKFKDGENSSIIRESSDSSLDGRIYHPELCDWAREDDRGWFFSLRCGGSVRIPHNEKLHFKDGFHARMIFSCDLAKTGSGNFQNLFTKGGDFRQGYSVMVHKNGSLMLNLRGLKPEYKIVNTGFQSHREYKLDVYVGNGIVRIFVDDKEKAAYQYEGKLDYTGNAKQFFIGQTATYGLTGNVYYFMIESYREPPAQPESEAGKTEKGTFRSQPLPRPEGTVVFNDFTKFEPASALRFGASYGIPLNIWICREQSFDKDSIYTMHPPLNLAAPHLTYDPGLKGKYDVFVNVRAVHIETAVQVRLSDMEEWLTVKTRPAEGEAHRNMDLCLMRNVEMDGKKLEIASCGDMSYLSCFKFIPAGRIAVLPPQDPLGTVKREKRISDKEFNANLQREISDKIASGYLKERFWVESRQEIPVSAVSKNRGFVFFAQPWMELLFAQAKPSADPAQLALNLSAARGEFEPLSFGIHALRPLKEVSLRVSRNFGKGVSLKISQVESMQKRTTNYTGPSEFMTGPQYLEPHETMSVNAGESRQFWITFHVDANAPSGIRQGELILHADGQEERIPVSLEIYPFALCPVTGYDIGFWVALAGESPEELDGMLRNMAEHGMTTLVPGTPFTLAGEKPGNIRIDFEKSYVTQIAAGYRKFGMTGNLLLPCDPLARYGTDVLKRLVKDTEAYAKAHGWPSIIWTSHDEVPSHPELFPAFIANLKALKEVGAKVYADHLWYKTTRPIAQQVAEAAQYVDVFILRYNTRNYFYADTWDQIMAECVEKGKTLYAYNSNNAISFPQTAAMRFASGWFFRSFGTHSGGQIVWAFNFPSGSPYTDLDRVWADFVYLYPPFGGRKGGPSIDYEAFREGCDDLRYILTLENAINTAREKGKAKAAEQAQMTLDKLKNSFDKKRFLKESVYFSSHWDRKWTGSDGKLYAAGNYNLPNGWILPDYDKARKILAAEIMKLNQKESME